MSAPTIANTRRLFWTILLICGVLVIVVFRTTIYQRLMLNLGLVYVNHGLIIQNGDLVRCGQDMLQRGDTRTKSHYYQSIYEANYSSEDLLQNSSFEFNGHSWKLAGTGALKPLWTTAAAYAGLQSLNLNFDGRDVNFYQTFQEVSVQKGLCYQLSAYVQTTGEVDNIGLDVWDAERGYSYWYGGATSPLISGANDWTRVSLDFCPPDDVSRIQIRLRRFGGYGQPISGSVWFDNVHLSVLEP